MIVITLTSCPNSLRGDLTKWLLEIDTGVFVGRVSARVRDNLWARVIKNIKNGRATMTFHASNEQGLDFLIHNCERESIDFDGVKLILEPSQSRINERASASLSGHSKAYKYRAAKRIAGSGRRCGRSEPSNDYAVIDVETTGLRAETSEIFEVAAIIISNGKIIDTFSALIKTEQPIPLKITELTGVTDEIVKKDGEKPEIVFPRFIEFVGNRTLVSHNVGFDVSFINVACRRFGINELANKLVDTLAMSREALAGLRSYSLKALCEHLEIYPQNYHRALGDCHAAFMLHEKLMKLAADAK